MNEAYARGASPARVLHRAAPIALFALLVAMTGCRHEAEQPQPPPILNDSNVRIVAWLEAESPCQQGTVEVLRDLEAKHPARVRVKIVDIGTPQGHERWEASGLNAMAIEIDGHTTVTWGEGDSRRTVSFMHPAGFTWTHEDLRAAVDAALAGELQPADPAEAEGVRLMDVRVRGQSIRVGDEGRETGQLIIQDQIVFEITQKQNDLGPGKRVSAAADALNRVLQEPFTPNRLRLKREEKGIALMAGEAQVLLVTEADTAGQEISPLQLAERWRRAVREALIDAALKRPEPAELQPEPIPEPQEPAAPEPPDSAANAMSNPLEPYGG